MLFSFSWVALVAGGLVYAVKPQWFEFSRLPPSRWLQWGGLLVLVASALLYIWSQRHLRGNFFAAHLSTENRTLVKSGPYSLVRNPIYLSYYLFAIGGAGFMLQLLPSLLMIIPAIAGSIIAPLEERDLEETFGQEYRDYKARTNRFIPRLY
jgi:protein-S-isoprenylcysteine O-methyltransferase Ste14